MVIVFCAAVDVFGLRSAKIGWILRIHEGEKEDSFFDKELLERNCGFRYSRIMKRKY